MTAYYFIGSRLKKHFTQVFQFVYFAEVFSSHKNKQKINTNEAKLNKAFASWFLKQKSTQVWLWTTEGHIAVFILSQPIKKEKKTRRPQY